MCGKKKEYIDNELPTLFAVKIIPNAPRKGGALPSTLIHSFLTIATLANPCLLCVCSFDCAALIGCH